MNFLQVIEETKEARNKGARGMSEGRAGEEKEKSDSGVPSWKLQEENGSCRASYWAQI